MPPQRLADDVAAGRVSPKNVNEKMLARYLDEPDMPDVDLFIRTSGEQRISNFLLWQSAYAELMFTDTRWPEFDRRSFGTRASGVRAAGTPVWYLPSGSPDSDAE